MGSGLPSRSGTSRRVPVTPPTGRCSLPCGLQPSSTSSSRWRSQSFTCVISAAAMLRPRTKCCGRVAAISGADRDGLLLDALHASSGGQHVVTACAGEAACTFIGPKGTLAGGRACSRRLAGPATPPGLRALHSPQRGMSRSPSAPPTPAPSHQSRQRRRISRRGCSRCGRGGAAPQRPRGRELRGGPELPSMLVLKTCTLAVTTGCGGTRGGRSNG